MKLHFSLIFLAGCASSNTISPAKMAGSILTVGCRGEGISEATAREDALKGCQNSAANYLSKEISTNELTISSSFNSYYLNNISSRRTIENLFCEILDEKINSEDYPVSVNLTCKFDFSKTKERRDNQEILKPSFEATSAKTRRNYEFRTLHVSSSPSCKTLTIVGKMPRHQRCHGKITTLNVRQGDEQIIVESDGYMPAVLSIDNSLYYQVLLERSDGSTRQ